MNMDAIAEIAGAAKALVEKPLAIPHSMSRLEKSVSDLQDNLNKLKDRLGPILRPSPEGCAATTAARDGPSGTLSTGISGVADHIDNLCTNISVLIEELEL